MASILLIAQEWTPRVLMRAQLREEGHDVAGCLTLDEGLLLLRRHPSGYDAVILDTLGQESSPRALARLASAGPPVLVLTGPYDLASVDLAGLGFRQVLVRPVFVGDVVAAVRKMLRAAGQVPGPTS